MEYLTEDNIRAALLGGVAIVVVVSAVSGLITGWVRKAKIRELGSTNERLREHNIRYEGTITSLNSAVSTRDKKILDLESKVTDLEEELKATQVAYRHVTISDAANQQRAEERQRQIEKLEAKIKAGEVMIHADYASVEARILALMNNGGFRGSPTGRLPNDGERYMKPHRVFEAGGLLFARLSGNDIQKLIRHGRGTEPVDEKMAAYLSLVTQHFYDRLHELVSHMKEDDRPGGTISFNIITQDATDNIKGVTSGKVNIPPEAL